MNTFQHPSATLHIGNPSYPTSDGDPYPVQEPGQIVWGQAKTPDINQVWAMLVRAPAMGRIEIMKTLQDVLEGHNPVPPFQNEFFRSMELPNQQQHTMGRVSLSCRESTHDIPTV